jgi:hypothetical protein
MHVRRILGTALTVLLLSTSAAAVAPAATAVGKNITRNYGPYQTENICTAAQLATARYVWTSSCYFKAGGWYFKSY